MCERERHRERLCERVCVREREKERARARKRERERGERERELTCKFDLSDSNILFHLFLSPSHIRTPDQQ